MKILKIKVLILANMLIDEVVELCKYSLFGFFCPAVMVK